MLIVRSPVRISFAGGGTDLPAYYEQFGGEVLSVSINKYFYTILGKRTDGRVQVISSDLRVFETWRDIEAMSITGTDLEIPIAILKTLGKDLSVDMFLASEIPPGTGLGSSASVCVNILKALTTYVRSPLSKHELAERSFYIARTVLGRHVGKQDEYAAAFGGLNFMTFRTDGSTEIEQLELDPEIIRALQSRLLLYFTGSAHHSWTILEEEEKSARSHSGSTIEALHEVRSYARTLRGALEKGDLKAFGSGLDSAWRAKKRVSNKISTSRIDELYSVARHSGALGGKITGAGGGGFLLLYCDPEQQDSVRKAMTQEHVQEMAFAFDFQGAQVIVNDPFIDADERGGTQWTFLPASVVARTRG
jgi:D-glycero-alpha-D-manno-heptose-7-phosphate kinase